ncbi:MAG TPA: SIS domain-containing protein [Oscillospiraceae bacterium]|nr:SIS domain-containing protein [Oscillospiraceae bacterium]HPS35137.1 SIS domain-containing protein [Oscillospiraceae bacterium]
MRESAYEAARNSIKKEAETIFELLDYLDRETFERAAELICAAPRIVTSGCGNSGIAAKKFAHCLCCIEKSAIFMPTGEAVHGGMGFLKTGDALILVSRGGKTAELLPMAEIARKKGAFVITITENAASPLAKGSDVVLLLKNIEESDPTGLMATSSFMAPAALFDAILSALIVETGYSGDRFGLIHPGGAVGEMLSTDKEKNHAEKL